jgi:hypothetical protein
MAWCSARVGILKSGVNLLLRALAHTYSLVDDGAGLPCGVGNLGDDRVASSTSTVLVREMAEVLAMIDDMLERRGMV